MNKDITNYLDVINSIAADRVQKSKDAYEESLEVRYVARRKYRATIQPLLSVLEELAPKTGQELYIFLENRDHCLRDPRVCSRERRYRSLTDTISIGLNENGKPTLWRQNQDQIGAERILIASADDANALIPELLSRIADMMR